jgi:transcription antitermination factor NusG
MTITHFTPAPADRWEDLGQADHPVRLTQGPFAEYMGTLDRLDESGRVRVLLDMLGRQVPVVEGHHVGRVA